MFLHMGVGEECISGIIAVHKVKTAKPVYARLSYFVFSATDP
jgi:hypothetical protein